MFQMFPGGSCLKQGLRFTDILQGWNPTPKKVGFFT